jgi:hypothetical protein
LLDEGHFFRISVVTFIWEFPIQGNTGTGFRGKLKSAIGKCPKSTFLVNLSKWIWSVRIPSPGSGNLFMVEWR